MISMGLRSDYVPLRKRMRRHGKAATLHVADNVRDDDPIEEKILNDGGDEMDADIDELLQRPASPVIKKKKTKKSIRTARVSMGKWRMATDEGAAAIKSKENEPRRRRGEQSAPKQRKPASHGPPPKTSSRPLAPLTLETVFPFTPTANTGIAELYEHAKEKRSRNDRRAISDLKQRVADTLAEMKTGKGKIWFIVEQPYWKMRVDDKTIERAAITKVPPEFRLRFLDAVLAKTNFDGCEITHVVTTLTSNFLTRFDTHHIDVNEEIEIALSSTLQVLRARLPSFKSLIILGYPVTSQYQMAYENLSNVLLDTTIKLRKQRDKCIQWCPISKAAALDFEAKLKKLPTVLNSVFQGSLTSAQIDVTA